MPRKQQNLEDKVYMEGCDCWRQPIKIVTNDSENWWDKEGKVHKKRYKLINEVLIKSKSFN